MNPSPAPLDLSDREAFASTSYLIAPLPVAGAHDLAIQLDRLANTHSPHPGEIAHALELATTVHHRLTLEGSPDRWIEEVNDLDPARRHEIISDLIAQRLAEADQVAHVIAIIKCAMRQNVQIA
jgi:hypothetical protein